MASRVFLDANILVEVILGRPKQAIALKLIQDKYESLYISSLSAHSVMYFGRNHGTIEQLQTFLADFTILPLESLNFEWAFENYRNNDFEDALQIAVALKNGCDEFITLDKKLVSNYGSLPTIKVRSLV